MSNTACSMYPCLVDEDNSTFCHTTEALEVVWPTKTGKLVVPQRVDPRLCEQYRKDVEKKKR
jgi:Zn-finger protein